MRPRATRSLHAEYRHYYPTLRLLVVFTVKITVQIAATMGLL